MMSFRGERKMRRKYKTLESKERLDDRITIFVDSSSEKDSEVIDKAVRKMIQSINHLSEKKYSYSLVTGISEPNA